MSELSSTDQPTIFDCEVFPNWWLVIFSKLDENIYKVISSDDPSAFADYEFSTPLVGYNNRHYDNVILGAIAGGVINPEEIYQLSKRIIAGTVRPRQLGRTACDIDLMPLAQAEFKIGRPTLKEIGFRLGAESIQDSPYDFDKPLSEEAKKEIIRYCRNDIQLTKDLYRRVLPLIKIREKLGKPYNCDWRSTSNSGLAERYFTRLLNGDIDMEVNVSTSKLQYQPPEWFKTLESDDDFDTTSATVHRAIRQIKKSTWHIINIKGNNKLIANPGPTEAVYLFGKEYDVGFGGLHSQDAPLLVDSKEIGSDLLFDVDAVSYYPSLIETLGIVPPRTNETFLELYSSLIDKRLQAKAEGDTYTAEGLKIVLNSVFGKFNSKFSFLFSPADLLRVTLSGQIGLLVLIDQLYPHAVCLSANTDGVILRIKDYPEYNRVVTKWQLLTGIKLEAKEIKRYIRKDVNNYLIEYPDGTLKHKGSIFVKKDEIGIGTKKPSAFIIAHALEEYFIRSVPVAVTILEAKDIKDFLYCYKARQDVVVAQGAKSLSRHLRWYISKDRRQTPLYKVFQKPPIRSVMMPCSTRAQLVNELPVSFPDKTIDYQWYVDKAKEIINVIEQSKRHV